MARNYYITQSGRIRRKDNTIYFEKPDPDDDSKTIKTPIPIEDVDSFYLFGETDMNTKFLSFLAQKSVPIHVFNYYGYYSGSYYPREYLNSGFLLVKQVQHYENRRKRIVLAHEFVKSAAHNIMKNLTYYSRRKKGLSEFIAEIESEANKIDDTKKIDELMGLEGRIRKIYYRSFNAILNTDMIFEKRVKRPPDNPINALISFGNSLMYSSVLTEIYRTQLNPTISYLHEPGVRRFSLSLDLAEIFKPIYVDRIIFKLINKKMISEKDFDQQLNYCYLADSGRKKFISEFDQKLDTTVKHKKLKRQVSYRRLIRLDAYKLIKHLTGMETYEAFRMWW